MHPSAGQSASWSDCPLDRHCFARKRAALFLLSRAVYFSVNLGLGALAASSTRRLVAPLCCVCCAGVFGVSRICSSLGCARACMRFLGLSCVSFWFLVSVLPAFVSFFLCLVFLPGACSVVLSLCFFYLAFFVLVLLLLTLLRAYSGRLASFRISYLCVLLVFCRFVCRFAGLLFVLLVCPLCFLLVGLSSFSPSLSLSFLSPLLCLASPHAKWSKSSVWSNKSSAKMSGQRVSNGIFCLFYIM